MQRPSSKQLEWIATCVVALWFAWRATSLLAAAWAFTTDDAYITLRYAHHLADGHGITWNVGEDPPVEGYSNFSFVLVGAIAEMIGADPVLAVKMLGVVALLATCGLTWWLARRWVGPLAALAPAIILTSYEGTVLWTVSGLETAVYQALVVGTVAAFVRALGEGGAVSRRWLAAAGALAFVAAITRPEGPLVAAVLLVALVARVRGAWRTIAVYALAFGVPYLVYSIWRIATFEALLPNSVACKRLHGDPHHRLLANYRALAVVFLPFALAHRPRDLDARLGVLLAIPALYVLVLRGIDPIIGHWNRHALTAWALLLVAATAGAGTIVRVLRVPAWARAWLIVALACGWALRGSASHEMIRTHADEYEARMSVRQDVGGWLAANLDDDDAYVVGDCGLIPYVGGGVVIDAFCLNTRAMAEPPLAGNPSAIADWIYARAPAALVISSERADTLRPRADYGIYPAIVAHPAFAHYEVAARFSGPQSSFHYWIYRRATP